MRIAPFVLLDRDGVINYDSDDFIKSNDEWKPIPDSLEAIAKLNHFGVKVVVITNQSGIGRGLFTETTLKNIHAKFMNMLQCKGGKVEHIYYCPHTPGQGCSCRKPKPGLLKQFSIDFNIDLLGLPFVGDTIKDIQAARCVHANPILVKTGKGEKTLYEHSDLSLPIFENLYGATDFILSR